MLQDTISAYRDISIKRRALSKEVAALEKEEKRLGEIILEHVPTIGELSAPGIKFRKRIKIKPVAADWNALYAYIVENDAFDLLHKRITEAAVKLRWDDSVQIPGIVAENTESLEVEYVE